MCTGTTCQAAAVQLLLVQAVDDTVVSCCCASVPVVPCQGTSRQIMVLKQQGPKQARNAAVKAANVAMLIFSM